MDSSKQTFNIMTWNVTGIMSSSSYLSDALNEHSIDFCGISEHWLYSKDLHFLDKINSNYISYASSDRGTSRQRSGKGAIRKRFPLQKPRWEKTKLTIRYMYLYHETYRKPNEQLFSQ